MQLASIETATAKKLFWSAAAGLSILMALTFKQDNVLLLAAGVGVGVIGLWPLYVWLLGSSHGLPIWPAFSAYSSAIAVMPVVQGAKSLVVYSDGAVLQGLAVTAAFLVVGSVVWLAMTVKVPEPPKTVLMLEPGTAVRSLFWCVALGILFQANSTGGWIQFPGNTMQIVRGIAGGLSYLGVFSLAYFNGAGLLHKTQSILFAIMMLALVFLSLTSLMLASIIPFIALALIGYTLGAGRVPWALLAGLFVAVALLHAGKYRMRDIYDGPEGERKISSGGLYALPSLYAEWFGYGMESLGNLGNVLGTAQNENSPSSVFERAGNLHMLLLVLEKTPDEVPYLNGMTYAPIPKMLVPRFLAPEKSVSHVGNIMLSISYGLQDEDGARRTSIGWSLVAEAYANFGFVGVFTLAVALAALYSEVTRLSSGVPITSFRFISGLIVLAGVTNENSLGVFITMQFQGIAGVALASLVMMRAHSNPFSGAKPESGAGPKARAAHRSSQPRVPSARAPWMPRKMQRRIAAQEELQRKAALAQSVGEANAGDRPKPPRPRQLAAPIQPYFYRSRRK